MKIGMYFDDLTEEEAEALLAYANTGTEPAEEEKPKRSRRSKKADDEGDENPEPKRRKRRKSSDDEDEAPKKRGRRSKKADEDEGEDDAPKRSRRSGRKKKDDTDISDSDLRKAASEAAEVITPDGVTEMIAEFGADNVKDIPQAQRKEFIEYLNDEVAKEDTD